MRISLKVSASNFQQPTRPLVIRSCTESLHKLAGSHKENSVTVFSFRFVTIMYPYNTLISHSRAKRMIVCIWMFSGCWGIFGVIRWKSPVSLTISIQWICINSNELYLIVTLYGVYIPMLILMTVINIKILEVTVRQIR